MPAVNGVLSTATSISESRPYFVLVTGFGVSPPYPVFLFISSIGPPPDLDRLQPFSRYAVNPSWLAVQPLHNTLIHVEVPADHVSHDDPRNPLTSIPISTQTTTHREIRITALNVPVTYEDVLSIVPGLHARPPVLPKIENASPPPPNGYDLVLHVGVAGRGPLRIERTSHKFGFNMKDANGCHAPVVRVAREEPIRVPSEPSPAERLERARLGYDIDGPIDGSEPPKRGFGKGYELFPEEISTDVDVEKLVHHLKQSGVEVSVLFFISDVTL